MTPEEPRQTITDTPQDAAARQAARDAVTSIVPMDILEAEHITWTLKWIDSGADLWRREAPATPPEHLVVYFVLVDVQREKVMLVDHIKAGLRVPSGGHVDPGERPTESVDRECGEELGIEARYLHSVGKHPLMLTVTETVGVTAGHTDVSLWYLLEGSEEQPLVIEEGSFHGTQWFPISELATLDRADPHMQRFGAKLHHHLNDHALN